MIKKTTSILFLASISFISLQAQENTNASGGNATGTGGNASYSVGQVAYTFISGTNGSANQGVQQPYVFTTGINDAPDISLSISSFPNPATSFVKLKTGNSPLENLNIELLDMNGKQVFGQKAREEETVIPMQNLSSGIYFLRVLNNNTEIKTFQIIKNN